MKKRMRKVIARKRIFFNAERQDHKVCPCIKNDNIEKFYIFLSK
ncbi:MAG: hypothetical protein U0M61_03580 [Succinivibrio sp.]|nr:hypothetical protein [Succinivibrio sp.]